MVEQGPGNTQDQIDQPQPGEFRIPAPMSPTEARDSYREVYTTIRDRMAGQVRPVPDEPEEIRYGSIVTFDE